MGCIWVGSVSNSHQLKDSTPHTSPNSYIGCRPRLHFSSMNLTFTESSAFVVLTAEEAVGKWALAPQSPASLVR
jgi:hypothetical protein